MGGTIIMTIEAFMVMVSFVSSTVALFGALISSDKVHLFIVAIIALALYLLIFFVKSYIKNSSTTLIDILMYKLLRNKETYLIYSKDLIYTYKDKQNLELEKRYCLIARKPTSAFNDRYRWSIEEIDTEITPLYKDDSIINKRELINWNYFTINFNKKYFKKEKINTGVKISNLYDPKECSKPFLSVSIEEKIKELNLEVVIPKNLKPKNAKFLIFQSFDDYRSPVNGNDGEALNYDKRIKGYSKKVNYPRKGWKYAIIWEFD